MAKTTVKTKNLFAEIEQVALKTQELKAIVETIPMSTVRKAFNYSVVNLEKKILNFTTVHERLVLTDEEKELIKKFRETSQTEVSQVSTHKISDEVKQSKKKK